MDNKGRSDPKVLEHLTQAAIIAYHHLEFSGRRQDIQRYLAEAIKSATGHYPASIRFDPKKILYATPDQEIESKPIEIINHD